MSIRILGALAACGVALCLAGPAGAAPFAAMSGADGAVSPLPIEQVQYYGPYRRYYGRPYYRRPGVGAGVAAGVAAGVLGGALAAGALAPPVYAAPPIYVAPPVYGYPAYAAPAPVYAEDGSVEYCARRYRSYNAATGTYIGRDGATYYCP